MAMGAAISVMWIAGTIMRNSRRRWRGWGGDTVKNKAGGTINRSLLLMYDRDEKFSLAFSLFQLLVHPIC
jgi:hypothetical protein